MHDPMTVAHEIRFPIPKVRPNEYAKNRPQGPRWSAYWYLGDKELYFPPLVTIWHNEPGGADSLSVCKWGTNWQWHVKHWSFQVHPVQHWRRRIMTRCAGCGGRSTKKNSVNHSLEWDSDKVPWWYPEQNLYHPDCASKESRKRATRHETQKNQETWDQQLAQARILTQSAEDLRYLGEEEAADYLVLRANGIKNTVSRMQEEARAHMLEQREKSRA